jgi:murein DD-endopeptidase MepM/ murein hydrolase activator NlpD
LVAIAILAGLYASGASAAVDLAAPWQEGLTFQAGKPCGGSWEHQGRHYDYGGRWGDDSWAIDFGTCGNDRGTPILAATSGTVIQAYRNSAYGNTIVIEQSPNGLATRYAHLDQMNVGVGQHVNVHSRIGTLGATGSGSAGTPHLHFVAYANRGARSGVQVGAMSGQRVCNGCMITSRPVYVDPWDNVHVASSNVLDVTAGDRVTAVVTATYHGAEPIPCGRLNLGVLGDRAAQYADYAAGFWPSSPWRSPNRVAAVGCIGSLQPGQQARWDLTFRPPASAPPGVVQTGVYSPVWEGRQWYDGLRIPISLRISSCAYRAQYQTQQQSPLVAPGETGHVMVALKNTGCETWERGEVNLGTKGDQPFPYANDSWKGGHNRLLMTEDSVAPGEVAHFEGDIAVPADAQAGQLKQYMAPVAEGKQWFGQEMGIYLPIFVGDKDHVPFTADQYRSDYVTQTNAEPLHPGDTTRVEVTFRNNGPAVLFADGAAPVHLRATPNDRQSAFVDASAPEAVGNAQGARMDQERVDPGEEFSFTLPVKVDPRLGHGTYKEYFRTVAEGKTWFGEAGMYWPFEVL